MRRSFILMVCAITTAITIITAFFPFVFFVPALLSVTLQKKRITLYSGFAFGIISFLYSYLRPSIVSIYFQSNPLLPIVPRVIAVVLAHLAYKLTYGLTKNRIIGAASCAVVGSLSNTVFTMMGLVLFARDYVYSGIDNLIYAIGIAVGLSALIEVIVTFITVPMISIALYKSKRLQGLLTDLKTKNTTVLIEDDINELD